MRRSLASWLCVFVLCGGVTSAHAMAIDEHWGLDAGWRRVANYIKGQLDKIPAGQTVYYVSGPVSTGGRGSIAANIGYGVQAADRLRAAGYNVISPFDIEAGRFGSVGSIAGVDLSGWSHDTFMRMWSTVARHPRIKGLILLPGWESSTGASQEQVWFASRGLRILRFSESEGVGARSFRLDRLRYRRTLGLLEDALLSADVTKQIVDQKTKHARRLGLRAVIVRPQDFALAAKNLAQSSTVAGAVIGFPRQRFTWAGVGPRQEGVGFPKIPTSAKLKEVRRVIAAAQKRGVSVIELDMVLDVHALKRGAAADERGNGAAAERLYGKVTADIAAVAEEAKRFGQERGVTARLKVIIETSLLNQREEQIAAAIVRNSAAFAIKTSTGFGPRGTTAGEVRNIATIIGDTKVIKASGGINGSNFRDIKAAGAHIFGTSKPTAILRSRPRALGAY